MDNTKKITAEKITLFVAVNNLTGGFFKNSFKKSADKRKKLYIYIYIYIYMCVCVCVIEAGLVSTE